MESQRNVSFSAGSTSEDSTHTRQFTNHQSPAYTCFIKSSLTYVLCCIGILFDAPPSTPPPPCLPQTTGPGKRSALASPGRIRLVHTSSWIRDGVYAKELSCKIFSLMLSFKINLYSRLLVNDTWWENWFEENEKKNRVSERAKGEREVCLRTNCAKPNDLNPYFI